tara:strand:- start:205 stop:513 length:309 start_codon:yes stop_codon:yes gene_type:complete
VINILYVHPINRTEVVIRRRNAEIVHRHSKCRATTEVGIGPKERIFVKGDDMTKYQNVRNIQRAVKSALKKEKRASVNLIYRGVPHKKDELPKYITDNPFYP